MYYHSNLKSKSTNNTAFKTVSIDLNILKVILVLFWMIMKLRTCHNCHSGISFHINLVHGAGVAQR